MGTLPGPQFQCVLGLMQTLATPVPLLLLPLALYRSQWHCGVLAPSCSGEGEAEGSLSVPTLLGGTAHGKNQPLAEPCPQGHSSCSQQESL